MFQPLVVGTLQSVRGWRYLL